MPIVIAPNPLFCVAIGSGQSLEEFEALKRPRACSPRRRSDVEPRSVAVSRRNSRSRFTIVLLVLTSITLLTLDYRGFAPLDAARSGVLAVLAPVGDATSSVFRPVGDVWSGAFDHGDLQRENEDLRAPGGRPPGPGHAEPGVAANMIPWFFPCMPGLSPRESIWSPTVR